MAGIYVHIPFCSQFCIYCNFYSVKGRQLRERYVQALHREAEYRKDFFRNIGALPQTIYFGGGTPSLFTPAQLGKMLRHICSTFGFTPVEATIEVNPNDIAPQYARDLVAAGFNRVSMGVQSFIDDHLVWMNRRHKGDEAAAAYYALREAGISNISLDLIFGYSSLHQEQWKYNINKMVSLRPEHISAYQMSIEPGSVLGKMYERGEYDLLPDNTCQEQYALLQQMLQQGGYEQYEISNFARRDENTGELKVSRHNSSYWTKEPYLGLGPAAHSYDGTHRFWNGNSVSSYSRYFREFAGKGDTASEEAAKLEKRVWGSESLSEEDIFNESVMLGLRTVAGVDTSTLNNEFLKEIKGDIARHVRLGNLVTEGEKIRIPSDKLFVSDGIIRDLFI